MDQYSSIFAKKEIYDKNNHTIFNPLFFCFCCCEILKRYLVFDKTISREWKNGIRIKWRQHLGVNVDLEKQL